jgi:hypothetical protein
MTEAPLGPEQVMASIGSGTVSRPTVTLWIQTAPSASLRGRSKITVDAVVAHQVLPMDTDPTNGGASTVAFSSVHPEDQDIEVFGVHHTSLT